MTLEQVKMVVRRYFEEFHTGRRPEIIDEILAPDLIEPTRQATDRLGTAFPDYRLTILEQLAEGERVATIWEGQGTHQGEWASPIGSVPPTGKAVRWTGTTTLQVTDGKIREVLGSNWDHLAILQQLAVLPAPTPRSGA